MDEKYISKYATGNAVDQALDDGSNAFAEITEAKGTHDDLKSSLDDLQGQINNIVRAPESGGDVAAEVAQARVDAKGVSHSTLKAREDSEYADLSNLVDSLNDDVSKEIKTIQHDLDTTMYKTKTRILKLFSIEDTYIDVNGNEHMALGTGNNWCTDFVEIPSDTIILVSKDATFSIAFYDEDKIFTRMIGSPSEMHAKGRLEIEPNTGEKYVRLSFWYANGYSAETHERIKLFYYRDIEDIYQTPENIANTLEWDTFTMGGDEQTGYHLSYSYETVSTHDFVKFDRPVLISSKNGYTYGVDMFNDELNKMYTSTWFSNTDIPTYIPAGFKLYIGVRNSDLGNNISMLNDMSEAISIVYADDIIDGLLAHTIENSVSFFGLASGVRRVRGFVKAEADTLLRPKYDGYKYTLTMCHDDILDYYSSNWEVLYSQTGKNIVPKGTWYSLSAGDDNEMPSYPTVEDIIEIKPYLFELSSLSNQVDGVVERLGALAKRLAILENIEVPSYYESHLTSKIETLNTLREISPKQLIFITDVHYNGYVGAGGNQKHSKSLLTKLCEETSINRLVNGGDLFNTGNGKTYAETMALIRQSVEYTQPDTGCTQYHVVGNHDTGYDYVGGVTIPGNIDVYDYAIASASYLVDTKVIRDRVNPTNYYFDDDRQKMRYIVSNGTLREFTGEDYTDTWRFIANSLSSAPDGYKIVIFQHKLTTSSFDLHDFTISEDELINAYNTRGSAHYSSAKADFTNAGGEVICVIGGHTHKDLLFTSKTDNVSVPYIITTTDNMGAELELTRTAGTITEQAFDVFTFDTDNNTIYVTRIGAGSDRLIHSGIEVEDVLVNNLEAQTYNGITVSPNPDGSMHFEGTASNNTNFYIYNNGHTGTTAAYQILEDGEYYIGGGIEGSDTNKYILSASYDDAIGGQASRTFRIPYGPSIYIDNRNGAYRYLAIYIPIWANNTVNFDCKPYLYKIK